MNLSYGSPKQFTPQQLSTKITGGLERVRPSINP